MYSFNKLSEDYGFDMGFCKSQKVIQASIPGTKAAKGFRMLAKANSHALK